MKKREHRAVDKRMTERAISRRAMAKGLIWGAPAVIAATQASPAAAAEEDLVAHLSDLDRLSATYAPLQNLAPYLPRQLTPKTTVWSAFQPGHGWTSGGAGITWNLNDTSDRRAGTQCVSFTTAGTSGSSWLQQLNGASRDLTNVDLTVWLKIDSGLDVLRKISVYLTPDNLVNYTSGTLYDYTFGSAPNRQMRQGEWFPLRFNFGAAGVVTIGAPNKAAMTGLRLNFQDNNGVVTGKVGLIEYHQRATAYPTGIVSLTFDDSVFDTYTTALPILAQRGLTATEYAIASLTEAGNAYGSMTVAQLQELQTYGWEVSAHAFTLANHDAGFDTLSPSALDAELRNLKSWLLTNGFRGADHLAYPRGRHSAATDEVVRRYFATGRTLYSLPQESYRPSAPLRMRCFPLLPSTTVAAARAEIDRAVTNGSWLILCGHGVTTGTAVGSQITITTLAAVADYLAASSAAVMPVGDVWRALA